MITSTANYTLVDTSPQGQRVASAPHRSFDPDGLATSISAEELGFFRPVASVDGAILGGRNFGCNGVNLLKPY